MYSLRPNKFSTKQIIKNNHNVRHLILIRQNVEMRDNAVSMPISKTLAELCTLQQAILYSKPIYTPSW